MPNPTPEERAEAQPFDAPRLTDVGEHECVTCTRCALTFAKVHPACPRCAEKWRGESELAELARELAEVKDDRDGKGFLRDAAEAKCARLALRPDVPKNGASFLLSRSVRLIKQSGDWDVLVTYADEWQGHTGTMYLAAGWEYVGPTKPERVYVLNGRMIARKAGPKTRTHADMLALGAECVGSFSKHKFRKVLR